MRTSSWWVAPLAWGLVGCGASRHANPRSSAPAEPPPAVASEASEGAAPEAPASWLELASLVSGTAPSPLQVRVHQGRAGTAVLLGLEAGARVLGLDESGEPSVPAVVMLQDGAPRWSRRIALEQGVGTVGGRVLVTESGVVYVGVGTVAEDGSRAADRRGTALHVIALDAESGAELARTSFEAVGTADGMDTVVAGALATASDGDLVIAVEFGGGLRLPGGSARPLAGGYQSTAIVRLSPDLATVRSVTHLPLAAQAHLVARDDGGVDAFAMLSGRHPLRVGRHTLRAEPGVWGRLVAVRLDQGGDVLELASFVLPDGAEVAAPFERGGTRVFVTQRPWGVGQMPPPPCEIRAAREPLSDIALECEDTSGVHVRSADGARGWVWRPDRPTAHPLSEPTVSLALERAREPGGETPAASILDVRAQWEVIPLAVIDSDSTPRLLVLTRPVLRGPRGAPARVAVVTLPPPGARADFGEPAR